MKTASNSKMDISVSSPHNFYNAYTPTSVTSTLQSWIQVEVDRLGMEQHKAREMITCYHQYLIRYVKIERKYSRDKNQDFATHTVQSPHIRDVEDSYAEIPHISASLLLWCPVLNSNSRQLQGALKRWIALHSGPILGQMTYKLWNNLHNKSIQTTRKPDLASTLDCIANVIGTNVRIQNLYRKDIQYHDCTLEYWYNNSVFKDPRFKVWWESCCQKAPFETPVNTLKTP